MKMVFKYWKVHKIATSGSFELNRPLKWHGCIHCALRQTGDFYYILKSLLGQPYLILSCRSSAVYVM